MVRLERRQHPRLLLPPDYVHSFRSPSKCYSNLVELDHLTALNNHLHEFSFLLRSTREYLKSVVDFPRLILIPMGIFDAFPTHKNQMMMMNTLNQYDLSMVR